MYVMYIYNNSAIECIGSIYDSKCSILVVSNVPCIAETEYPAVMYNIDCRMGVSMLFDLFDLSCSHSL